MPKSSLSSIFESISELIELHEIDYQQNVEFMRLYGKIKRKSNSFASNANKINGTRSKKKSMTLSKIYQNKILKIMITYYILRYYLVYYKLFEYNFLKHSSTKHSTSWISFSTTRSVLERQDRCSLVQIT